jgi:pimeloyl-ACP methyl ester carboxylesterase
MTRLLLFVSLVYLAVVTCAATAFGQFVTYSVKNAPQPIYAEALPVCAPDDLRKVSLPNTTIDNVISDDNVCRVALTVTHPPATDQVKVWVALPMKNWNGRLLGQGGVGFAGGLEFFTWIPAATGYVTVATDGGHDPSVEGAFAMTADGRVDWQSLRDFSHLAVHEMTVIAKALTQAFYGKPARYAYFCGLSNGGRQAIQAAQRYPEDYNGVISAAPAIQYGQVILTHLWPQVVMLDAKHTVSPAKLIAVTAAVIEACDANDGAVDGVIDDPIRCDWDPKALVGKEVGDGTFTEADAHVIRKIWAGPRTHDGKFLWYGFPRGSDLTEFATKPPTGGSDWIKYFLLQDPKWDWKTITMGEYELLFKQSDDQYASLFAAPPPDLSGLRDHKGKLIIVQGMADQMVPPEGPIGYYENVVKRMGGLEQVQPFARLFLVPGINHMMEGSVGLLDSLILWVEDGQAPEQITWKTKIPGGETTERPVFPYPLEAVYQPGDSKDDEPAWVSKEGPRFPMK